MKNHYDILGLSKTATQEQIKTAYRKLSVKFHPDKNDGEAFFSEMFRQVNEAYTVLYNSQSRKSYDLQLFKFEHPEQVTQQTSYKSSPNQFRAKTYTPPPPPPRPPYTLDKWSSVKKWQLRRNALFFIDIILIFIVLLSHKSSNISAKPPDSLSTSTYHVNHRRYRRHRNTQKIVLKNEISDSVAKAVNEEKRMQPISDTVKMVSRNVPAVETKPDTVKPYKQ